MPQRKGLYFMLMRTTWTPHGKQFSYPQPKKASIQRSALGEGNKIQKTQGRTTGGQNKVEEKSSDWHEPNNRKPHVKGTLVWG